VPLYLWREWIWAVFGVVVGDAVVVCGCVGCVGCGVVCGGCCSSWGAIFLINFFLALNALGSRRYG
jgi:hypothetical protein